MTKETLAAKLERTKELEQEQYRMMVDLYSHYRNGTFLSVDIVNSTKLKEGEDSLRVIQTFQAFHRSIGEHIKGSLASVFSGDGVMCLYETPQEAVDVAVNVLRGLPQFNKEQSSLRRYLNVRIGINSGTLLLDDVKDLGKLTERNIDIAGHLQKYGGPGEILISASTWERIRNKTDFSKRWKTIDNTVVYKYRRAFSPSRQRTGSSFPLSRSRKVSWGLKFPPLVTLRRVVFSLLAVGLLASGFLFYRQWDARLPLGLKGEKTPIVVDNQVKYMGQNKFLTEAKMKQGNDLVPLPTRAFLVIPAGKNTPYNRKNGLHENTVYSLERVKNDRYYVNQLGIFALQVEILDGYLIFLTKRDAENYLRGKSDKSASDHLRNSWLTAL